MGPARSGERRQVCQHEQPTRLEHGIGERGIRVESQPLVPDRLPARVGLPVQHRIHRPALEVVPERERRRSVAEFAHVRVVVGVAVSMSPRVVVDDVLVLDREPHLAIEDVSSLLEHPDLQCRGSPAGAARLDRQLDRAELRRPEELTTQRRRSQPGLDLGGGRSQRQRRRISPHGTPDPPVLRERGAVDPVARVDLGVVRQ